MSDATPFTSHAGLELSWKIDCDSLTDADWSCIAAQVAQRIRFRDVIGVPSGGLRFAAALEQYADQASDVTLIVDDVLTTGPADPLGASLRRSRAVSLARNHAVRPVSRVMARQR